MARLADGLDARPQVPQEDRLGDDRPEASSLGFEDAEDRAIDRFGLPARLRSLGGRLAVKKSSRASGPSTRRRTIEQPCASIVSAAGWGEHSSVASAPCLLLGADLLGTRRWAAAPSGSEEKNVNAAGLVLLEAVAGPRLGPNGGGVCR